MKRSRKDPTISMKDRDQRIALELFRSSAFLMVNKTLLRKLGANKTIFLENLVDKHKYWEEKGELQPDGSFFLSHENQCEQTGLSEYQIREYKRDLVGKGILVIKKKGLPAREYYRINFSELLDLMIEEETGLRPLETPVLAVSKSDTSNRIKNQRPLRITKFNNNKSNIFGVPEKLDPDSSIKEINRPFLPLAEKLATIIQSNKNINISPLRLASWAADIGKLSRVEGVPPERIESALDWYADNIGGQYIPVIESGGSLRNKFIKLEEAMKRSGFSPFPTKQQAISSKRLIRQEFGGLSGSFEKNCYLPALNLIPDLDKPGKAELAKALIAKFKTIDQKWESLPPEKKSLSDLGPMTVLQRFIEWLGDQAWITNKDPRIFRNDKIFNSFYSEYVRNIGG